MANKVTVGGSKKITLMNQPYEPIVVESTIMIEKELDENVKVTEVQDRINKMLDDDLKKKAEEVLRAQESIRKRMKQILADN
jgi:hypothetical protein